MADVLDSLLSARPYKQPMDFDRVLEVLVEGAGNHLDPRCVKIVIDHAAEFLEITSLKIPETAVSWHGNLPAKDGDTEGNRPG